MDVGEEVVQPLAHIDLCQFAASHKGVDDGSVLGGIMVCRKDSSYAPKPYCNLFSHGELGSAGLDGLYKEVTEQIGNLFHEKDRISDYICNFVSDIKVLYSELYLIIKILS